MKDKNFVKRAIIMAAGEGKRMRPLTLTTPKPLVKVKGVRMIETVIKALQENGIREIYIVVGYLKEQFYPLEKEFGVRIIESPYYDSCNNISSLYCAREYIPESIIIDGDQVIYNPDILIPEFSLSGYNAVWCEKETDEWLMDVEDGIVKKCSRTGGSHGWQLYSVSRWTKEDGLRLSQQVREEFESGNKEIYWDDVAMFLHFNDYTLGIREMKKGDIIEIDSLEELADIDSSYKYLLNQKEG